MTCCLYVLLSRSNLWCRLGGCLVQDERGVVHKMSAVCPHMKGILAFIWSSVMYSTTVVWRKASVGFAVITRIIPAETIGVGGRKSVTSATG